MWPGQENPTLTPPNHETFNWCGEILSFQNSKDRVFEEANSLEITLQKLSFLPLNVCIYFGHFYEKHFIPFPLTDLEMEAPPLEEGPSCPRKTL